jgi:hypothetical protein
MFTHDRQDVNTAKARSDHNMKARRWLRGCPKAKPNTHSNRRRGPTIFGDDFEAKFIEAASAKTIVRTPPDLINLLNRPTFDLSHVDEDIASLQPVPKTRRVDHHVPFTPAPTSAHDSSSERAPTDPHSIDAELANANVSIQPSKRPRHDDGSGRITSLGTPNHCDRDFGVAQALSIPSCNSDSPTPPLTPPPSPLARQR